MLKHLNFFMLDLLWINHIFSLSLSLLNDFLFKIIKTYFEAVSLFTIGQASSVQTDLAFDFKGKERDLETIS